MNWTYDPIADVIRDPNGCPAFMPMRVIMRMEPDTEAARIQFMLDAMNEWQHKVFVDDAFASIGSEHASAPA